ncbi:MAG: hypothetical protein CBARDCOR_2801 [uncultured Caballeronia sp.]|nr:MAG: hypothetical protein CBARDCOR_2801 [uncultured Caballeronia sp.]
MTTRPQLELIPAAVSTPRPVPASTLTVDGPYVTGPLIVPTVASRMPNIKADLQSLRGSLATGATTRIDDEVLAAPSSASSSSMARRDAAGLQASLQVSQNAGGQARNAYLWRARAIHPL